MSETAQTLKLTDFLEQYQDEIVKSVVANYPPLYDFGNRKRFIDDLKQLKRKPFLAQLDGINALAKLYESANSGILVGEMGTGKTICSIVLAYVLGLKRVLVMCPPHLIKKWEREIRITLPTGSVDCYHLKRFTDIDQAVAATDNGAFNFYIVGRERAKLSYQWKPAFRIRKQKLQKEVWTDLCVCPDCGKVVTESDGTPLTPADFKKRKIFCRLCSAPLWQAYREGPRRFAIAEWIKRKHKGFFDLLIVDECFPAGTKIETLFGEKNIEDIRVGERVLSHDGNTLIYKKVTKIFSRIFYGDFREIDFVEGKLSPTPNHGIYTPTGKVQANSLHESDRIQWLDERADNAKTSTISRAQKKDRGGTEKSTSQKSQVGTSNISTNADKQPNEKQVYTREDGKIFTGKAFSNKTRGSGDRIYSPGEVAVQIAGLENRNNSQNTQSTSSLSLFSRCWKRIVKNCRRMRRLFALPFTYSGTRQEKRSGPLRSWLGCSAIQKRGDFEEYEICSPKNQRLRETTVTGVKNVIRGPTVVYNLEVEDLHKYFANKILVSNCHEYKARGSAQGYAAGILASCCQKSLALTGTLFGGYSSTLFHLLYRLSQGFKSDYGHGEVSKWIDHFGIWERVTKYEDDPAADNTSSRGKKYRMAPREKPGINPVILPKYLLDKTVFIRLSDIAIDLPSLSEEIIDVEMAEEQAIAYHSLFNQLRSALVQELRKGSRSLLAIYLQALLTYPDRSMEGEQVYNKLGDLVAEAPALSRDTIYPKEKQLLDLVKAEKAAGRRVLVFCTHTKRRDTTQRLLSIFTSNGLSTEILKQNVASEKREAWIQEHANSLDCLITNPKLVQTGLDLVMFPTIIFFEVEYSVYVLRQASRRSWRIGQDQPVKIYYMIYGNTMQEQALKLVALKMKTSLAIEGDLSEDGLGSYSIADDNLYVELARNIAKGSEISQSLDSIWHGMQVEEQKNAQADFLVESLEALEDIPELNGVLKTPIAKIRERFNPELWENLLRIRRDAKLQRKQKPRDPNQMSLF